MTQRIDDMPHNGNLLAKYIPEHYGSKSELARKMGVTLPGVNDYCRNSSLQTSVWWRASQALQHNFLAELADDLGIDYDSKAVLALREELTRAQQEINRLQQENGDLKIKVSVYESLQK
jgi:transcriptional regulator with XRE-family HTH domain